MAIESLSKHHSQEEPKCHIHHTARDIKNKIRRLWCLCKELSGDSSQVVTVFQYNYIELAFVSELNEMTVTEMMYLRVLVQYQ